MLGLDKKAGLNRLLGFGLGVDLAYWDWLSFFIGKGRSQLFHLGLAEAIPFKIGAIAYSKRGPNLESPRLPSHAFCGLMLDEKAGLNRLLGFGLGSI